MSGATDPWKPFHDLAAKWDATAARNQRNGQSLVDQGDECGNEGLAIAEALGDCVVDLRALLADYETATPAQPKPAPELADAMADPDDGYLTPIDVLEQERDEAREQLAATKLVLKETSRESSQRGEQLATAVAARDEYRDNAVLHVRERDQLRERLDAIRKLCEARIRVVGMVDGKGVARKVIAIIDKPAEP